MTDRWNPKWVTRPVVREPKFFVPGDMVPQTHEPECASHVPGGECSCPVGWSARSSDLNSQHRVTEHPAGFRVRERGALDATVVHAYRCPVHGIVDVRVPRSDVPDEVDCPTLLECEFCGPGCENRLKCGKRATWAGSQCGQGWAAGECKS